MFNNLENYSLISKLQELTKFLNNKYKTIKLLNYLIFFKKIHKENEKAYLILNFLTFT